MTVSLTIHALPKRVPDAFTDLYSTLEAVDGAITVVATDSAEQAAAGRSVLAIVDPAAFTLGDLDTLASHLPGDADVTFVVGDGYLGTDDGSVLSGALAAGAVSVCRSLALDKGRTGRANVVCVPQAMFGGTSSLRGPLPTRTEPVDVAHAIAYLAGPSGAYVSGQTLFVNGGRHIFSSQTA